MSSPSNIQWEKKNQSNDYLHEMQNQRFEVFKQQDLETGGFDVTLEIDGKILHVHKYVLTSVSEFLDAWLSTRWTTKDEVIKIQDYCYDNFYEFLRFLYTGNCLLTEDNIVQMVDIAEFYGVQWLKNFCDDVLSDAGITVENLQEMYEFAQKYSLPKLNNSIKKFFFSYRCEAICKSKIFLTFKKSFIEFLLNADNNEIQNPMTKYKIRILFEGVYKWAEHRVTVQRDAADKHFNLLKAIKTEFSTLIPHIKFTEMPTEFLMNSVMEKGFTLSPSEMLQFFLYRKGIAASAAETALKTTYKLAKKQALKQQEMFPVENFNLVDSIKASLVEVIPHVKFVEMDENFINDFVVANEILTVEQASHIFDTRVEIQNNGKTITGTFKDFDRISIRHVAETMNSFCNSTRQSTTKIRFPNLKFTVPKTPCTVSKMKGCDWYLCLETDEILTFKHHSIIQQSDYLIAEMKSSDEFKLTPGETTYLNAFYNNVS